MRRKIDRYPSRFSPVDPLRDGPTGWFCEFELRPFNIGSMTKGLISPPRLLIPSRSPPNLAVRPLDRTQQKKKLLPKSLIAFSKVLEEAQGAVRDYQEHSREGTVRAVQVADVRASFARQYRPGGGGGEECRTANDRRSQGQ
jgi:hypothetical protein